MDQVGGRTLALLRVRVAGCTLEIRMSFVQTLSGSRNLDLVEDVVASYEADQARIGRAERTTAQTISRVRHLAACSGREHLADVTAGDVRSFLERLQREGMPHPTRPPKGCGAKALNNHLASLRAFFDWAIRAEYVVRNPCVGIERARRMQAEQRAFTPDEVRALIIAAGADERSPDPRCRRADGSVVRRAALYQLLASTGIRVGTAWKLRWSMAELGSDPPRLVMPASILKSGRAHSVVLTPEDVDALRPHRPPDAEPVDLVFEPVRHEVLRSDARAGGVAERDELGRRVGFHSFRRFVGTALARAGVSPRHAQDRLGHADVATTLRHYTAADQDDRARAADAIRQVLVELRAGDTRSCYPDAVQPAEPSTHAPGDRTDPSRLDPKGFGASPRSEDHPPGGKWAQQDSNLLRALAQLCEAVAEVLRTTAQQGHFPPGGPSKGVRNVRDEHE